MFTFGVASSLAEAGEAVSRTDWSTDVATTVLKLQVPDENSKMTEPYFYKEVTFKSAENGIPRTKVVRYPYLPSMSDLLAKDWMLVKL